MSTKSTICSSDDHHLFENIALDNEPLTHVQLQIELTSMFTWGSSIRTMTPTSRWQFP